MKKIIIIILTLACGTGHSYSATLDLYRVLEEKTVEYRFLDACRNVGAKHTLYVNIDKSGKKLDCMGQVLDLLDYCSENYNGKEPLVRQVIDVKNKVVRCVTGKTVSLIATRLGVSFKSSRAACLSIKNDYAKRLSLAHGSFIDSKNDRQKIRCFFSKEDDDYLMN